MTKQIWKYRVGTQQVPTGSTPLTAQYQDGVLCVWVEVDPANAFEEVSYLVAGTGQAIPREWQYIGTVQQGELVWHVYEVRS